jgi:streptogramin lyase
MLNGTVLASVPRALRWPVRVLLGIALAVTLQAAEAPAAGATEALPLSPESFREFPLERSDYDFAFGIEAGIWYVGGGDEIMRVTQSGIPTGNFTVTYGKYLGLSEPEHFYTALSDLTAGSDGAMWFASSNFQAKPSEVLGRIDTVGNLSEYKVAGLTGHIQGLAAGPDAKIWFTVDENAGAVKRISEDGELEGFSPHTGNGEDLPKQSLPSALIAGPDGNMWFIDDGTNDEGRNLVGRVTPSGEVKEYALPGTLAFDQWIIAGPGGDVWIGTGLNTVYRVTPDGKVTTFLVPRIAGELGGLAAGPEGDVWYVADGYGGSTLGRLTPSGEATLFEPLGLTSSLGSPTLGPDGKLWFTGFDSITGSDTLLALALPVAPLEVSAPEITGEAVEGQALTLSPGEWKNATTLSFRWSLCDASGAGCEALLNQEGRSIGLLPFYVGHTLSVTATAGGPGGSATATSAPSTVIRAAPVASTQRAAGTLGTSSTLAPTLGSVMTWEFGWSHRGTRVKSLRLHNVPPGAVLEVRCRGRACPFRQRRIRPLSSAALKKCKVGPCLSPRGGQVELAALWRGRRLRAGDLLEVAVAHADYRGKLFPFVIRSGGPPRPPAIRCLVPESLVQVQSC